MALVSDQGNSVAAKKVLLTLWDYMSTPDQIKRMQDIISNPKRLDGCYGYPYPELQQSDMDYNQKPYTPLW